MVQGQRILAGVGELGLYGLLRIDGALWVHRLLRLHGIYRLLRAGGHILNGGIGEGLIE